MTLNKFGGPISQDQDGRNYWHSAFLDVDRPLYLIDWTSLTETGMKRGSIVETSELAVVEWANFEHAEPMRALSILVPGLTGWQMCRVARLWAERVPELSAPVLVFTDLNGSCQDRYFGQRDEWPKTEPIWVRPTYDAEDFKAQTKALRGDRKWGS